MRIINKSCHDCYFFPCARSGVFAFTYLLCVLLFQAQEWFSTFFFLTLLHFSVVVNWFFSAIYDTFLRLFFSSFLILHTQAFVSSCMRALCLSFVCVYLSVRVSESILCPAGYVLPACMFLLLLIFPWYISKADFLYACLSIATYVSLSPRCLFACLSLLSSVCVCVCVSALSLW